MAGLEGLGNIIDFFHKYMWYILAIIIIAFGYGLFTLIRGFMNG